MIVRVFRARARPGREAEFEESLAQRSIPLVESQKGVRSYFAGRPAGSASDEFVMITIWEDLASLKAFAGDDWEKPVIPDGMAPLMRESFLHHYEAFGSA